MNLTDEEIRIKVAEAMGYERRPCEWQRVTQTNSYTLEVCHETKEYLETDSSD